MFNRWNNSECFPKRVPHFTFSLTMFKGSNFSTSLPSIVIWLFDFSHASGYNVLSHFVLLIFISLMMNDSEHLFMCLLAILPWRNVYSDTLSIKKIRFFVLLLLNCKSSLYIMDTSLLLDIYFVNIFFHSIECVFAFLIITFEAQHF